MDRLLESVCGECGHKILVDTVPAPTEIKVVEVTDEGAWCAFTDWATPRGALNG